MTRTTFKRNHLIWCSWSQRFSPWLSWWGACQQAGSHDDGTRAAKLHLMDKQEAKREINNW